MSDELQDQVVRAMDLLRPGRLRNLGTGEEVPTTLVERVQNVLLVLHAEESHAAEMTAALAAEQGLARGATEGWGWSPEHNDWRKEVRHVRMWVHRVSDRPGWVHGASEVSWSDDDLVTETQEGTARMAMHFLDKRVRDHFETRD